ncbi:MAG: PAS domain S-box protein [Chitinophagaceae bacterium]|nr:MAG: PAS domain S-box protein [Chitinophagaceae bacterium]
MRRSAIPKTVKQLEVIDISNAVLQSLPGAVICADMEGVIIHFNPAAEKIFHLGTAEACGKPVDHLLSACSASQLTRFAAVVFETGLARRKNIRLETMDGVVARLSMTISLLRDENNVTTGFCALAELIPVKQSLGRLTSVNNKVAVEVEGAEERLRQNEKRFRSIVENSADGIAILGRDGSPKYLSPSIKNILGYDEATALQMNLFTSTHPDDLVALGKLWTKVLASPGVPIRAYPCRVRHADGSYRVFDGTLTNLLHDPAVDGIVDNFRDVTEMVQSEEHLKSSEERYRHLFQNNPVPMWVFDPATLKFLAVNDAATVQYGYTIDEFMNISVLDIRTPEAAAKFLEAVARRKQGGTHNKAGEFEHVTKDGKIIHVDIVSHLIRYEGIDAILVLAKDITEQKKANSLLFKSYRENNQILENIGDGFFSLDKEYTITYWNKAAEEIVRTPRSKVLGKSLWKMFETAQRLKFFAEYKRAFRDQVTVNFEEYYPELGLWLEVTAYPSDSGLSVFFRDITARKKAMDKIRQANEKFSMIARITNDAIYEWDIVEDVMYWGEGYATLFGHKWTPGKMSMDSWRDFVHPSDKENLMKIAQDAFKTGTPSLQREIKFRCADGSYKLVYDKLVIVYAEDGTPLRLMGAMQDVTEKRMMETSLQNAKNRQQRAVTRATIQGQEKEREQIGIELHDNINQILATASLYIEHGLSMPEPSTAIITQGKDMIQLATKEIRKLSHALLPPSAGDFGLVNSINELADGMNLTSRFSIDCHVRRFDESILPREQRLTFYRIVQEQLNNILKHAQCTRVEITLRQSREDGTSELTITDNGKGFNVLQKKTGVGLRNMMSRAELFCGKVNIITSPGNGCKLTVVIPVNSTGTEDCTSLHPIK